MDNLKPFHNFQNNLFVYEKQNSKMWAYGALLSIKTSMNQENKNDRYSK